MGQMVTVKQGCTHHRMAYKDAKGKVEAEIEELPAGTVFEATEAELRAFADKLLPSAITATDEAWALAQERQVNMVMVKGSGKGGRILKSDVEAFLGDAES